MAYTRTPDWVQRLFPRMQWHGHSEPGGIYLTFDDGPTPGITPWVLDQLKAFEAKATFFVVGRQVEKHPELVRRIITEGHTLGNHTYTHRNGWKTGPKAYMVELERTRRLLNRITGKSPDLFRPPYGKFNIPAKWAIQRRYRIVMWDVLARDYDPECTADDCIRNVVENSREGSIIVLHDSVKCALKLREVLPPVLQHFKEQNLRMLAL